jgi:amino acid permease
VEKLWSESRRREETVKTLLGFLMIANAALFFFGAVQHIGVTIGRFQEPRIIPAAIVETICGISLTWGAVIVFSRAVLPWSPPLVSNFIALCGVLLGVAALAAGRGPRTASNDLYHHIMLSLIAASFVVLMLAKSLAWRA